MLIGKVKAIANAINVCILALSSTLHPSAAVKRYATS
jgi:hypothetical protein